MAATLTMTSETLAVPGARLYYEVRGTGPVLLMMPGGPADASTFRRIEKALAERYTVVTYDPRGLSHSELEEPLDDARMVEIYADDVHRLLAHLGKGRASVFASSGGAVFALELAARHPEQLDTVIVHEPPSPTLQPNPAAVRAAMEHVSDTYASAGLWSAMQEFAVLVGIQAGPPSDAGEPSPQDIARMQRNMDFFIGRYVRNLARYEPDLDALKSCPCTIVPAIGEESTPDQLARTGSLGLARVLDTEVVVFPGDHGGFDGRPVAFAARLLEVLDVAR